MVASHASPQGARHRTFALRCLRLRLGLQVNRKRNVWFKQCLVGIARTECLRRPRFWAVRRLCGASRPHCAVHHRLTHPPGFILEMQVCEGRHRVQKTGNSRGIMKTSCGHGEAYECKDQVGAAEVAYFRAKAEYLRRAAIAAAKSGFMHPAAIIRLLERLAGEFEKRAFEVERELKARHAHRK
jgi:hypothetical protein